MPRGGMKTLRFLLEIQAKLQRQKQLEGGPGKASACGGGQRTSSPTQEKTGRRLESGLFGGRAEDNGKATGVANGGGRGRRKASLQSTGYKQISSDLERGGNLQEEAGVKEVSRRRGIHRNSIMQVK